MPKDHVKDLVSKLGSIFHAAGYPMPSIAMGIEIEELLKEYVGREFDNHHNALTCPYCSPKEEAGYGHGV